MDKRRGVAGERIGARRTGLANCITRCIAGKAERTGRCRLPDREASGVAGEGERARSSGELADMDERCGITGERKRAGSVRLADRERCRIARKSKRSRTSRELPGMDKGGNATGERERPA
jgi:hypothetical protein